MDTGLSPDTDQTIINLAHAFDGYVYANKVLHTSDDGFHEVLGKRMIQVQESGRLFLKAEDNFATNYYLHRNFHHQGWLPEAKSPQWYTMLFFTCICIEFRSQWPSVTLHHTLIGLNAPREQPKRPLPKSG